MANPQKGEIAFDVAGKERVLRLDTNAICTAEEDLDLGIDDIVARLSAGRLSVVRVLLRAGMVGDPISLRDAGELIDEIGARGAIDLLSRALAAAFPPAKEGARPPKGEKAGTGKGS